MQVVGYRCLLPVVVCLLSLNLAAADDRPVRFNRDIRPLLTDRCLACHGPDAKTVEGDLRLDLREDAVEKKAIVPGDINASELVRRILSSDVDEVMPPPESHKTISDDERKLIQRWIAEGAEYEAHWAYEPLSAGDAKGQRERGSAAIDGFVSQGLSAAKVDPVPKADRVTLIRRLSFDLTGMPPTPVEVDAFLNDKSEDAYAKLVDRLLKSPRYGERMAIYWLDLVRYADTVGYHGDQDVSQSPFRDYVIQAFNDNMPYDRFVREQLAGDLLPEPTTDQLVASGYNRLNQTTEEGGSQAKEYLAIYFADRVRNVSQVFMGATIGCAQCHDHKYDPYTARDFYSLGAFFADLDERGVYGGRGSRPPTIRVLSKEIKAQMAAFDEELAALKAKQQPLRKELLGGQEAWEQQVRDDLEKNTEVEVAWVDDVHDTGGKTSGSWNFVDAKNNPVHSGAKSRKQSAGDLVQHFFDDAKKRYKVEAASKFFVWIYLDPKNPPKAVMLQINDGNWEHRAVWGGDEIVYGRQPQSHAGYSRQGALPEPGKWARLEVDPTTLNLPVGREVKGLAFTQFAGLAYWDKAGWITGSSVPQDVRDAIVKPLTERDAKQKKRVEDYYVDHAEAMVALKKQISAKEAQRKQAEESSPTMVISKAVKPRTIRILPRGNWMDESGEVVQPAIPEFLGKLDTGDSRATRLDLANWLCESDNVLTSRTMANRIWYLLFGRGVCTSVDDFGGQGTFPSHPELLDWLAAEFVESGWNIKHLVRTIVMSETYRRSSKPSERLAQQDPYNDLFARQGRYAIPAEMIRDAALVTSGLLVEKVGGTSAKPYQPAGYYAQLNFPRRKYVADMGDSQYRRGVYTHWQRTFLHPMLKAFDAPSREECTAQRSRSNTPIQALTLLNDPSFVEAARVLAARVMREGGEGEDARIAWAYRLAVSRKPNAAIAAALRHVFDSHYKHYQQHVDEAKQLVAEGNAPADEALDPAELAAWTSVARVILNLHETITRY